jgi:hypothetical protein
MAERGIRLRRSLEDAVGGFPEAIAPSHKEEKLEWGEEDIEYNAEELRRLRPY